MTTRRLQPKRAAQALAIAILVGAVGGACGASGDGDPAATSAPPAATSAATSGAPPSVTSPTTRVSATSGSSTVPSTPASGASSAGPTRQASDAEATPGTPSAVGSGATQPVQPVRTKQPVPLDDPADFGTGLAVRLTDIAAVQAIAQAPGEIAGPALRITVQARNASARAIPVDRLVVFVAHGMARTPASNLSKGTSPLTGSVRAKSSKAGTYVFAVPADGRTLVRVEVSYSGQAPTVAFEGPVD